MSRFNEDLILKCLVDNVNLDLAKKHSLKTVLMLDYCYKKNEPIPQNVTVNLIAKIESKQVNNSSKPMNLDTTLEDYLFFEYFGSLLSSKTKNLMKDAKTAKDFKAIIILDEWSKRLKNSELYLNSASSLDSKVFSMTKAYKESRFEKELYTDYVDIKEYYLRISADLRKPLTKELVERFSKAKKELDEKLKSYSKYNIGLAVEIQNLIRDTSKAIDNKLSDFINNINQRYNKTKRTYDDSIWDSEKKINQLISLRSELKDVKDKYQLVLCREGVNNCSSLDRRVKDTIHNHNYIRDKKEEFQEVKREVSDYYARVDSIFCKKITCSSVSQLNRVYSRLRSLSSQEFHECVPSAWQENYYSNIKDSMGYIKYKCTKRINYLTDKSSRIRQKIDGSWFSWNTKKFAEQLEKYNSELEAWSRCQII